MLVRYGMVLYADGVIAGGLGERACEVTVVESRVTTYYAATPLSSASAWGGRLPAPWVRPFVAFSDNTQEGQFELYLSATLVCVVKYSMQGPELRLLEAETPHIPDPQIRNELWCKVMDDAIERLVAVIPFSTAARYYRRKHRVVFGA